MAVGEGILPQFKLISGIRLGVAQAGIKKAGVDDLVLIELRAGSTCAGTFTQNVFCAAPVTLSKDHLESVFSNSTSDKNCASYLLVNTGNANAGTGQKGMDDAKLCCQLVADYFDVGVQRVLPFSTGVIGEYLPVDKIQNALASVATHLDESNWAAAAKGILTTDTRAKGVTAEVQYAGKTISISGISKGAGMIKPDMATMLAFIGTDATISNSLISGLVKELAKKSFNRITIDGDTSTNDSCMLFASGASSAPELELSHPDFPNFKAALKQVFVELAQAIVKDGEGATKFVTVSVEQALDAQEALEVAYTIAHSPLIKTAFYASDPNWGRILAAVGRAPLENLDLSKVAIYLDEVRVVYAGEKCATYTEEQGQRVMDREEITIRIELGRGQTTETVWTSDLSHEYVTINAEYRT